MGYPHCSNLLFSIGVFGALFFMTIRAAGFPPELSVNPAHELRFQILEGTRGEAVLDIETQLIWERSPSDRDAVWATARLQCALASTGGHMGWRLPSFLELMTLVDFSPRGTAKDPSLPAGHPFRGVRAGLYWTTSSTHTDLSNAYAIDFLRGDLLSQRKNQAYAWWCVLGRTSKVPTVSSSNRSQESI